jgi:hypothetical protein
LGQTEEKITRCPGVEAPSTALTKDTYKGGVMAKKSVAVRQTPRSTNSVTVPLTEQLLNDLVCAAEGCAGFQPEEMIALDEALLSATVPAQMIPQFVTRLALVLESPCGDEDLEQAARVAAKVASAIPGAYKQMVDAMDRFSECPTA